MTMTTLLLILASLGLSLLAGRLLMTPTQRRRKIEIAKMKGREEPVSFWARRSKLPADDDRHWSRREQ